ncbi:MAG: response regulator [Chloroflexota bacterium]|nr:response regulator [Chloroflexota bacterium]
MVKVLIIDDEVGLLEDTLELLGHAGYDAMGASTGAAGIEMTLSWSPDIIVCDNMMPGMTGLEMIRALRSDISTALVPIIMFTSYDEENMRHQARLAGADDFVTKPFRVSELIETIEVRLQRHALISASGEHRLEMARTQLVRMVTHELRTPLISMNTVVEVLSRQMGQLSPKDIQELLDTVIVGSRRLTHRVEQLVFITQLDAGALSAETVLTQGLDMAMWEMLIAANNLARRFAYQMQPGVTVNAQTRDYESLVLCNPYALKQALAELIANALTFAPSNTEVTVRQWRRNNTVFISVTDMGMGIPADEMENAVQRFQQIGREKNEQQGMGVGLWLAQRILAAHGGALDIRSVVGTGTQVIVRLPVARVSATVEAG